MRVLDGDTFEARVSVWPGLEISDQGAAARHRCPGNARALHRGERRRHRPRATPWPAILAEGAVGISQVTLDKYGGRVLAAASTRKTADVSAALLHTGLVRSYRAAAAKAGA